MQAPQGTPEPNARDCRTDVGNDGQPCRHCAFHINELTAAGVSHQTLSYPAETHPVIFNCHLLYRYDSMEPHEYCQKLNSNFCHAIWKTFGAPIPISTDFALYKGESTWHEDQNWTLFASFLVDLPLDAKVDVKQLPAKLELGDMSPSKDDWTIDDHEDRMSEDWGWCRLKWLLKRAGIYHHPLCCESLIGRYQRAADGHPNALEEFIDNMQPHDDSWAFE
ncbi:hypothetical protein BDV18DRAFT_112374 [Aspergillus unguis]